MDNSVNTQRVADKFVKILEEHSKILMDKLPVIMNEAHFTGIDLRPYLEKLVEDAPDADSHIIIKQYLESICADENLRDRKPKVLEDIISREDEILKDFVLKIVKSKKEFQSVIGLFGGILDSLADCIISKKRIIFSQEEEEILWKTGEELNILAILYMYYERDPQFDENGNRKFNNAYIHKVSVAQSLKTLGYEKDIPREFE